MRIDYTMNPNRLNSFIYILSFRQIQVYLTIFVLLICLHAQETALALPLGELSPQVTERALQPVLNRNINLFAYSAKISVNIPVGKA